MLKVQTRQTSVKLRIVCVQFRGNISVIHGYKIVNVNQEQEGTKTYSKQHLIFKRTESKKNVDNVKTILTTRVVFKCKASVVGGMLRVGEGDEFRGAEGVEEELYGEGISPFPAD